MPTLPEALFILAIVFGVLASTRLGWAGDVLGGAIRGLFGDEPAAPPPPASNDSSES